MGAMGRLALLRAHRLPRCPIGLGEPCSLCVPGVSGPQDCGLVYLVMSDPELRERLHRLGKQPVHR